MAKLESHPKFPQLLGAIQQGLESGIIGGWKGNICRYAPEAWGSRQDILSGQGAYRHGGRWNGAGVYHAGYCALEPDTAHVEYFGNLMKGGIDPLDALPMVARRIEVKMDRVLNLRDTLVLGLLGMDQADLLSDPWDTMMANRSESLCQALGRAALMAGVEGIIAPSAAAQSTGGNAFIIILENAGAESGKWKVAI